MSLLLCPFCGAFQENLVEQRVSSRFYVVCMKCMAEGPNGATATNARQLWNSRTLPPEELAAEDDWAEGDVLHWTCKHKHMDRWCVMETTIATDQVEAIDWDLTEAEADALCVGLMRGAAAAEQEAAKALTSKPAETVPPIMASTDPRPAEEDDWRLDRPNPEPFGDVVIPPGVWMARPEATVIPRGTLKPGDKLTLRSADPAKVLKCDSTQSIPMGTCPRCGGVLRYDIAGPGRYYCESGHQFRSTSRGLKEILASTTFEVRPDGQWNAITPLPAELTTRLGYLADRLAIASGQGVGAYMAELCTQSADAIREVLALVQPTKGGER